MNHADTGRRVAPIAEYLADMAFARIEIPSEIGMGQTHYAVRVRIPSRENRRARRAALGRRAEVILEEHALFGQAVEIR